MTPTGPEPPRGLLARLRRLVIGAPLDLAQAGIMHRLSLVAVLAWIGLGADALSSSAYGPEEAFSALRGHVHLAIPLALATAATVFLLAAAYSRVIEVFPNGGGYGVATRLLGPRLGAVSGSALLVDYVLTITASIAAMGNALFSLLPPHLAALKLPIEAGAIIGLTVLNLRGVRESILVLAPVFLLFVLTHILLIAGGIIGHAGEAPATAARLASGVEADLADPAIGLIGLTAILLNAYALGGGTYTGIEAVSNALPLMREPRVHTAKRTMLYLSISLAVTAGGLILCYLLWQVAPVAGKTMNAVLAEEVFAGWPGAGALVWATLLAEALLLVVAAQAGFVGGPRVMANMAIDGWLPRRFSSLSDRLTTANGILVMGAASLAALLATGGDIKVIVVMYAINVFLTFSLTMTGMVRYWWKRQGDAPGLRRRRLMLFGLGAAVCSTILAVTVFEKFVEGGWVTVAVTGSLVVLCTLIRAHYRTVGAQLARLYRTLEQPMPGAGRPLAEPDPQQPTAIVLVSGWGGPGIHTVLNVFKSFPGHFRNVVFVTVGVVDSGEHKGEDAIAGVRARAEETIRRYLGLAASLGIPAAGRIALGTDPVETSVRLCRDTAAEFRKSTVFAGKVLFARERWYHALLHNDTAFAVQRRLQWDGITVVVLPARCQ